MMRDQRAGILNFRTRYHFSYFRAFKETKLRLLQLQGLVRPHLEHRLSPFAKTARNLPGVALNRVLV
jgi:hypothetical protein